MKKVNRIRENVTLPQATIEAAFEVTTTRNPKWKYGKKHRAIDKNDTKAKYRLMSMDVFKNEESFMLPESRA